MMKPVLDYPIEPGQRMLVKPNGFGKYADYAHFVVCLGEVLSTDEGIIAKDCFYFDNEKGNHQYIDIPLFLLWRIADDEDLLEMHESYLQSKKLANEH